MGNALAIKGAAAELRWGYATAATLSAWSLAGAPGAWTLTATLVSHDAFKVSQRPLVVVTPNGWRWPVSSLQIADGALTATVEPGGP